MNVRIEFMEVGFDDSTPSPWSLTLNGPGSYRLGGTSDSQYSRMILKAAMGLISPLRGTVLFNGQSFQSMDLALKREALLQFGFVFERGGLLQNQTLGENALLAVTHHRLLEPKEAKKRIDGYFSGSLSSYRDKLPSWTPDWAQKMALFARALVLRPRVLVMEDPFTGLNTEVIETVASWIQEHEKMHGLSLLLWNSSSTVSLGSRPVQFISESQVGGT